MKNKTPVWVPIGLLLVAMIWGSGFIATQIAIDEGLSSSFIMFVRFTMAFIIMGIINLKNFKCITKRDIKGGSIVGLFLFLSFLLQTVGLKYTTPAANAFITATSVVIVPFFSWIIFKSKPENKVFLASIICLLGIATLTLSGGSGFLPSLGDSITFLGAIGFAMHTLSMGYFSPKMDTKLLTFLQIATAALLSFAIFLAIDRDFSAFHSIKGLIAILYLAVCSTCIAYFIQTLCQKYASPSQTSILISTESLFGTALSVCLGFEPFSHYLIIGGITIFISVIMIETNIFSFHKNGGVSK